jgi:hypothetical protein
MSHDSGRGISYSFINVNSGQSLMDERVDELVGDEGVGTLVTGIVTQRFGKHVCRPPLGDRVSLRFGG